MRTTGTVDWDNDHTTQAITQVSGPITRIVADTGTRVKAGDPLLYVASADITNAVSTYRKAKNRFDLAQRMLDRSKDLFDAQGAVRSATWKAAQADYNDAATDLQTALQALKIFGVSQAEITEAEQQNVAIQPELVMRAPLAGTVVQKMVLPGQFIQAGHDGGVRHQQHRRPSGCRATSTTRISASVHVGDKVDERNASFPQTFHGVGLLHRRHARSGDAHDAGAHRHAEPDGLLKKDLFVDVVIHDKTTRDVLVVPTTAVLYDEQNFPFVYVQVEPGKFAQRLVKLGGQQGDDTQVVDGLKAGEPVVVAGQRVPAVRQHATSSNRHDQPHRLVRPVAALHRHRGDAVPRGLGRRLVPEPADRRLSRICRRRRCRS